MLLLQVGEQVSGLCEFREKPVGLTQVCVGIPPCLSWPDPPRNQGTLLHCFEIGAFGGEVSVKLVPVIEGL